MSGLFRVLLLDPVPWVRAQTQRLLVDAGGSVRASDRLQHGLECLRREPFDVIVTEYRLRDAHGEALFSALKQQAPMLPLVVCSGMTQRSAVLTAIRLGVADYWVKPLTKQRLLYALDRLKLCAVRRRADDVAPAGGDVAHG